MLDLALSRLDANLDHLLVEALVAELMACGTATSLAVAQGAAALAARQAMLLSSCRRFLEQIVHPLAQLEVAELLRLQKGQQHVLEVDRVGLALHDLAEVHPVNFLAQDLVLLAQDALLELEDLTEGTRPTLRHIELMQEQLGLLQMIFDAILHLHIQIE